MIDCRTCGRIGVVLVLIEGDRIRLGYPGDGGLGSRLAREVAEGRKTSTCLPAAEMTSAELEHVLASVGRTCQVVDAEDRVWCPVLVTDAYLATFREPSAELLRGEGYGDDVVRFQRDLVAPPAQWVVAGVHLSDDAAASLERLPPAYRLVVTLHDALLWSVPDIAAATGERVEVVRQRLRRGRMRLAASQPPGSTSWGQRHRGVITSMDGVRSPSLPGTPRSGSRSSGEPEGAIAMPPDSLESETAASAAVGVPAVLLGSICVILFTRLDEGGSGA
jgi:uncharacterized protein YhfF